MCLKYPRIVRITNALLFDNISKLSTLSTFIKQAPAGSYIVKMRQILVRVIVEFNCYNYGANCNVH